MRTTVVVLLFVLFSGLMFAQRNDEWRINPVTGVNEPHFPARDVQPVVQRAVYQQREPIQAPVQQPAAQETQVRQPRPKFETVKAALDHVGDLPLAVEVLPCRLQGHEPQLLPSPVQVYPYGGFGIGYGYGYGWLDFTPPFPVEHLAPAIGQEMELVLSRPPHGKVIDAKGAAAYRLVLSCSIVDQVVRQKGIFRRSQDREVAVVLYGEMQDAARNILFKLKGEGIDDRREAEAGIFTITVKGGSVQQVAENAVRAVLTDPSDSEIVLAEVEQDTAELQADVKNAKKIRELERKQAKLRKEMAKLQRQ